MRLSFIGGGNMARAIIGGLLDAGHDRQNLLVAEPVANARASLEETFDIRTTESNIDAYEQADVLVLAVKPQVMASVVQPLRDLAQAHRPLIISIAAGIPLQSLQNWFGADLPMVRCMPNTPALLRAGASGLFANASVDSRQKHMAQAVLEAVGSVHWLATETDIDRVTALSGSGPAYFFLITELMEKAAIAQGLDPDIARSLARDTALGAGRMLSESGQSASDLRQAVTSPGGTTAAALQAFAEGQCTELVRSAMDAAFTRAQTLAEELGTEQ